MDSKACSKCGCTKPFSEYSPRKEGKNLMSQCKECRAATRRQDRASEPEKHLDIQRRCRGKRTKEFHYERARRIHLKSKYGITPEEYQAMWDEQGGLCFICDRPETRVDKRRGATKLAVDHNHIDGKVRKLLCVSCNTGLGSFKHNQLFLIRAVDYLDAHE